MKPKLARPNESSSSKFWFAVESTLDSLRRYSEPSPDKRLIDRYLGSTTDGSILPELADLPEVTIEFRNGRSKTDRTSRASKALTPRPSYQTQCRDCHAAHPSWFASCCRDQHQSRQAPEKSPKPFLEIQASVLPRSKSEPTSSAAADGRGPDRPSILTRPQFLRWSLFDRQSKVRFADAARDNDCEATLVIQKSFYPNESLGRKLSRRLHFPNLASHLRLEPRQWGDPLWRIVLLPRPSRLGHRPELFSFRQ